jgi:hypothetical protein
LWEELERALGRILNGQTTKGDVSLGGGYNSISKERVVFVSINHRNQLPVP